jgi:hypothetical protein
MMTLRTLEDQYPFREQAPGLFAGVNITAPIMMWLCNLCECKFHPCPCGSHYGKRKSLTELWYSSNVPGPSKKDPKFMLTTYCGLGSKYKPPSLVKVKIISATWNNLRVHSTSNQILLHVPEVINDRLIIINHGSGNFSSPFNLTQL